MKTLEEIKTILREHKRELVQKYGVKEIAVFGSCVSGKQGEKSDVDILVAFYEPIGWEFIDLKEFLEEILGKQVDLVTVKALKPQLRDKILKEVIYA